MHVNTRRFLALRHPTAIIATRVLLAMIWISTTRTRHYVTNQFYLLARNPIDIAVSWYFQFTKRQSAQKQELINHFIDHPVDRNTITMWDFVRHSDIGLLFLIEFLNQWEKTLVTCPNSLIIRYEDLRVHPVKTLTKIHQTDEGVVYC